jgi:hypothetical protein
MKVTDMTREASKQWSFMTESDKAVSVLNITVSFRLLTAHFHSATPLRLVEIVNNKMTSKFLCLRRSERINSTFMYHTFNRWNRSLSSWDEDRIIKLLPFFPVYILF